MSRPDELPSWCDDDDPVKVDEPSPTKKLAGFLYKERPAMQFWNWIQRNFVKWILHLDVSVNQFDPHAASTPDMTVIISAGKVQNGTTHTVIAEQTTSTFTAPSGNPRIDRIVIDNITGVYSVIAGAESASPVAPVLTSGKIAICQVLLDDSPATTTITNDLITDERPFNNQGNKLYDSGIILSAVTQIDISDLDLAPTERYKIVYEFRNDTGSGVLLHLTINGDHTLSNYNSQSSRGDGASDFAARDNDARFVTMSSGSTSVGEGFISVDYEDDYRTQVRNTSDTGAAVWIINQSISKIASITGNLISLRITADIANGIGVGSRFRIYKED